MGKLDNFYRENNIDSQDKTQFADQQQEDKQQEDQQQETNNKDKEQEQAVKTYEENNVVIVENDSTIVGKLQKDKPSSKILPKII